MAAADVARQPPDAPRLVDVRDIGRVPVWIASKTLYSHAPLSLLLRIATARGALDALYSRRHRRVLTTLEAHFGSERSHGDLRRLARRHVEFQWRSKTVQEWPQFRDVADADAIAVEGLEHLDRAFAHGRGAVLLSAHYGHSRLIKPILRAHGRAALLVGLAGVTGRTPREMRPYTSRLGGWLHTRVLRLPTDEERHDRWTRVMGTDLQTGINLRDHVRALAANNALLILVDGAAAHTHRPIPVLGVDVRFASGAVGLVRSTGAAALPTFLVDEPHRGGARLRLVIGPPLDIQRTRDANADLEENLGRFAAAYEAIASSHAHNWLWPWVRDGAFTNPRA